MTAFSRALNSAMNELVSDMRFEMNRPLLFQMLTDPEGYASEKADWEAESERRWNAKPHSYGPWPEDAIPLHLDVSNTWWWLPEEDA